MTKRCYAMCSKHFQDMVTAGNGEFKVKEWSKDTLLQCLTAKKAFSCLSLETVWHYADSLWDIAHITIWTSMMSIKDIDKDMLKPHHYYTMLQRYCHYAVSRNKRGHQTSIHGYMWPGLTQTYTIQSYNLILTGLQHIM